MRILFYAEPREPRHRELVAMFSSDVRAPGHAASGCPRSVSRTSAVVQGRLTKPRSAGAPLHRPSTPDARRPRCIAFLPSCASSRCETRLANFADVISAETFSYGANRFHFIPDMFTAGRSGGILLFPCTAHSAVAPRWKEKFKVPITLNHKQIYRRRRRILRLRLPRPGTDGSETEVMAM